MEDFEDTIEDKRGLPPSSRFAPKENIAEGVEGLKQQLRQFFEDQAGHIFGEDIPLPLEVEAYAIIDEVLSGYKDDDNEIVKRSYVVEGEASLLHLLRTNNHN